ncbi:MAG: hypothetical protein P1U74_02850 [Legionellaceae bacterium]|nr:hypothetical protein [Legionellaceae bacterium]
MQKSKLSEDFAPGESSPTTSVKSPVKIPRTIKKDSFVRLVAKLLQETVTPLVKSHLGRKHPSSSKVLPLYLNIGQINGFLTEVQNIIEEIDILSPTDAGRIARLIISDLAKPLTDILIGELDFIRDDIRQSHLELGSSFFSQTLMNVEGLIRKLLVERQERIEAISGVSRVQFNEHRRLRRLDSLAELLELNSSSSLCASVTLSQVGLVVSANNSGFNHNQELAQLTMNKMSMIREFIISKSSMPIRDITEFATTEEYHRVNLDCLASDDELGSFVESLQQISRSYQDPSDLKQNLRKLLKSFFLDIGPFSKSEKNTLLYSSYSILLPDKSPSSSLSMFTPDPRIFIQVFHITNSGAVKTAEHNLGVFPETVKRNNIHAEQMMLFMLKFMNVTSTDVGVSKDCCIDCSNVFKEHPNFLVRGTSGLFYPNTASLPTGDSRAHTGSPLVHIDNSGHERSPEETPGEPPVKKGRTQYISSIGIYNEVIPEGRSSDLDDEEDDDDIKCRGTMSTGK